MICIGYTSDEKRTTVAKYCAEHNISKVFALDSKKMRTSYGIESAEHVDWPDIIEYRFFYRLLQEIGKDTLVVVDECLRTQDRNCLTYNCMRHFLNQTRHQLIFQYLPIIDTFDDFAILFDFDTRSRWKREKVTPELLKESRISARTPSFEMRAVEVETDAKTRESYAKEKRKLIDGLGLKDPHTIPRNLHMLSGKSKLAQVKPSARYVGRNNRLKLDNLTTYKEPAYPDAPYVVFEFCHNFIDFSDFLSLSRQVKLDALVSDLKVDRWYFERYQAWLGRVRDAFAAIQR